MKNKYEKATAIWISKRTGEDSDRISDVTFEGYDPGGCPTCGWDVEVRLSYRYSFKTVSPRYKSLVLDTYNVTPGKFVEECVEIMKELNG